MRLPDYLLEAIDRETAGVERRIVARAASDLTERYKREDFAVAMPSEAHRAAYLSVRLPATYAAGWRVFSELRSLAAGTEINSMLDLGAGPGTAVHAAGEIFPSLHAATLVESDPRWVEIGKRLLAESSIRAEWRQADLRAGQPLPPRDLVVISYALGELGPASAEVLLRQAWSCANRFLAIIEPGTMRGFGVVNAARSSLISAGAALLAPCPHALACPMAQAGDWCHFAQRLERTAEHRRFKGGALGYEDEKFSYVIAGRPPLAAAQARIVRHPRKHSGHVQLTLCTASGLETRTVTKSQKDQYKKARQAEWGDAWNVEGKR